MMTNHAFESYEDNGTAEEEQVIAADEIIEQEQLEEQELYEQP